MPPAALTQLLDAALAARDSLLDSRHRAACRLFNGFTEGAPELAVDLYADTLVVHNYTDPAAAGQPAVDTVLDHLRARLPWLRCAVVKHRAGLDPDARRGLVVFGDTPATRIQEHGVWYAVDLTLNRDASFYLDTRHLRAWLHDHLSGKTLLNTFAYTGSLGVAASAGGAARVVQLDRNPAFLQLARDSLSLNGLRIRKSDFLAGDFFPLVSRLKRAGERFDCVIVDPPFFSATGKGTVDLAADSTRLLNKVRPLVNHGGHLVAINNALYLSGRDYLTALETLCADGYLSIAELIPVPDDFLGTGAPAHITDPAPFNHPTKIAILQVRRKDAEYQ